MFGHWVVQFFFFLVRLFWLFFVCFLDCSAVSFLGVWVGLFGCQVVRLVVQFLGCWFGFLVVWFLNCWAVCFWGC